jgi:uncharacterized ParB-like nuclease family protein
MAFDFSDDAKLTNDQLAGELAKLTPLTMDEINDMLPRKIDKQRFQQLLEIVGSAAAENNKVAQLTANIGEVGGVVVRLLGAYLKLV